MTAAFRVDVMSSPSQKSRPALAEADVELPPSKRHVTDAAVADAFIRAVRGCTPEDPYGIAALHAAVVDYVDAARARSETHERAVSAVRHMVTTLVLSPAWCGVHRAEARDIIRSVVALASERFYVESAYRDAQPSTSFHFEVRSPDSSEPLTRRAWDNDEG